MKSNVLIQVGIVSELIITIALIYVPFFAAVFMTHPLALSDFIYIALCPVVIISFEEMRRSLCFNIEKRRHKT